MRCWCDVLCNCPQLPYCTIDTLCPFRDVVSIIPCLLFCHYYFLYFHESSLQSCLSACLVNMYVLLLFRVGQNFTSFPYQTSVLALRSLTDFLKVWNTLLCRIYSIFHWEIEPLYFSFNTIIYNNWPAHALICIFTLCNPCLFEKFVYKFILCLPLQVANLLTGNLFMGFWRVPSMADT